MSNEITMPESVNSQLASRNEQGLGNLASDSDFLGRLQLMISNSELCKEGKFPINHFAYFPSGGGDPVDLGESVDVGILAWRPQALDMSGESVISCFDEEADLFKQIQARSGEANSGCMFGPQYLVWIPQVEKFAGLYFGSKSARREANGAHAQLKKFATLIPKKCETPKFTWYTTKVVDCETPHSPPDAEALEKEVNRFLNPPATEQPEAADDNSNSERAR